MMNSENHHIERLEELKTKLRAHPAFRGGQADISYWKDLVEVVMIVFPEDINTLAEMQADQFEQNPEKVPNYIVASKEDRLAYRALKLWKSRLDPARFMGLLQSHSEIVNQWIFDVFTGRWIEPRSSGKDKYSYMLRDATIAAAVNGIRDLGDLPYTSHDRESACQVVSEWTVSSNVFKYPPWI